MLYFSILAMSWFLFCVNSSSVNLRRDNTLLTMDQIRSYTKFWKLLPQMEEYNYDYILRSCRDVHIWVIWKGHGGGQVKVLTPKIWAMWFFICTTNLFSFNIIQELLEMILRTNAYYLINSLTKNQRPPSLTIYYRLGISFWEPTLLSQ
jgi:hypothetical protein